ncbi:MAG: NADH-quinone oxidoreductase subunit L [Armatimonadetes bacterium]|nr:NADH-quinone oxidoreductase subunit L [Armatimonadota bacterium]
MDTSAFNSVWWIFALPVFGFLWQCLAGKIVIDNLGDKLGKRIMGASAVLPIAAAFFIAVDLTGKLHSMPAESRSVVLTLFDWINIQSLHVPFEFRVDALSMMMVLIITGIGSLIHLYATGYMAEEKDYPRFFTYLNLFVAAMLVLVLGNNLVLTFIGWEGVGLCSYLLIGFWYKDVANSKAANKAFIVNRIGDFGFTIGMFLLIAQVTLDRNIIGITDPRWLSFDVLLPHADVLFKINPEITTMAALALFVGAMGKSAQFPLYLWLPDAMAGPTPVSALIHAATMVTSGVFLLNRMSPVFAAAPQAGAVIAIIGAATSLLGALIAFGQTDIKKVLAFSTVSQLGYMFIGCGVGAYWAGMFHVTTHAFFKALLFLGAGAVIHAMAHDQDMRNYGGLWKFLKITGATMLVGWAAIAGFPYLSGFFSKEEILGAAVNSDTVLHLGGYMWSTGQVAGWIGFVVAFLTAAYMTRMTLLTFFSGEGRWKTIAAGHGHDHDHEHGHHDAHAHAHHHEDPHGFFYSDAEMHARAVAEPHEHHHALDSHHVPKEVPPSMWMPLAVLAVLSLVGGAWLKYGVNLEHWLYPGAEAAEHAERVSHPMLLGISFTVFLAGVGFGFWKYAKGLPADEGWDLSLWKRWRTSAGRQFGIDAALTDGSLKGGAMLGAFLAGIDKWLIDGVVNASGRVAELAGGLLSRTQRGYVRGYALLMQAGVVALIFYVIYQLSHLGAGN